MLQGGSSIVPIMLQRPVPLGCGFCALAAGRAVGEESESCTSVMLTDFNRDKFCLALRNETFLMKTKILALFLAYV